jgi:hypothetical protein
LSSRKPLELLLGEVRLAQLLIRLSELVVDVGIAGSDLRGGLQMLDRFRGRTLREEDLAEQVARVGQLGLRLHDAAEEDDRFLPALLQIEHGREVLLRDEVGGVRLELRPQGRLRLRETGPCRR